MTVLTVVTDTVKIFLLFQDIKYNKLRNKKMTTSVHRQCLWVPIHFSVYMKKKNPTKLQNRFSTLHACRWEERDLWWFQQPLLLALEMLPKIITKCNNIPSCLIWNVNWMWTTHIVLVIFSINSLTCIVYTQLTGPLQRYKGLQLLDEDSRACLIGCNTKLNKHNIYACYCNNAVLKTMVALMSLFLSTTDL